MARAALKALEGKDGLGYGEMIISVKGKKKKLIFNTSTEYREALTKVISDEYLLVFA